MSRQAEYWKKADEPAIERAVDRLVRTREPTGWRMSVEFEIDVQLLSELIRVPIYTRRPWVVIGHAVGEMAKRSLGGLIALADCINERIDSLRAEVGSHTGSCWLIMPLNLAVDLDGPLPRRIRILGTTFTFMRIDNLRDYLGCLLDVKNSAAIYHLSQTKTPYVVCVEGSCWPTEAAFDQVAPAFDALRGAMELCQSFGRMQLGAERPWGSVPHPRIVIVLRAGEPADVLTFVAKDWEIAGPRPERHKGPKLLDRVDGVAKTIPEAPRDGFIEEKLADLLRLYSQALEQEYSAEAFLAFWQFAEALTLRKEDRGKTDRVASRLSFFESFIVAKPDGRLAAVLHRMMEKRNEAIHQGVTHPIRADDVNLLKLICEVGFKWLHGMQADLPTVEHLHQWWAHCQRPDRDLEAVGSVVSLVQKRRQ